MKNHKAACELADQALQDALDKIDELEEDDFRDAKSIIELLKENLTLWKEEEEGDNQIDDLWELFCVLVSRFRRNELSRKATFLETNVTKLHCEVTRVAIQGFWSTDRDDIICLLSL